MTPHCGRQSCGQRESPCPGKPEFREDDESSRDCGAPSLVLLSESANFPLEERLLDRCNGPLYAESHA